jgi:hypothetical protein
MTLAATGEVAALEACFPRACGLARPTLRLAGRVQWRMTTLLVLGFLLVTSCGVAVAYRVKSNHEELLAASARLARVLTVDCR